MARRPRARPSGLRRAFRGAAWLAVALVAGAALAVALADTPLGRGVAEWGFETVGSATSRGEVRIGRVSSLPPRRLVLEDYEIIGPDGRRALHTERLSGELQPGALLDGEVRFVDCRFERTTIWLRPGPGGQVGLVYASEVPDGRPTTPLVFEDITLVDNTIHIDLPGKPAFTMRHVYGRADLRVSHLWRWTFRDNHGVIDVPLVDVGFSGMNGRLTSDSPHPLAVSRSTIDLGVATPVTSLDYFVPALAGLEGSPYFEVDLPAEPVADELACADPPPGGCPDR